MTGQLQGIWDVDELGPRFAEASKWAQANIPDALATYRVEFYVSDCPYAIVYRYVRDDEGPLVFDEETGGPQRAEPVTQVLAGSPPMHLLRGEPDVWPSL